MFVEAFQNPICGFLTQAGFVEVDELPKKLLHKLRGTGLLIELPESGFSSGNIGLGEGGGAPPRMSRIRQNRGLRMDQMEILLRLLSGRLHIPRVTVCNGGEQLQASFYFFVRVCGLGAEDEVGISAMQALAQPEAGLSQSFPQAFESNFLPHPQRDEGCCRRPQVKAELTKLLVQVLSNLPEALPPPGLRLQQFQGAQGRGQVGGLSPAVLSSKRVAAQVTYHRAWARKNKALSAESLSQVAYFPSFCGRQMEVLIGTFTVFSQQPQA